MYVVERFARGHRYLYLVESVREGKTVRQRTIKALGRKDVLAASGELDRLAASIARHADRSIIVSDINAGRIAARRIGGPLLFGRLWQRLGVDEDHRPELAQMILAVVIDAEGRPICTEMVPGNTADVKVLMPIVMRLRTRFGITRSCVVADRGMISADTIAALEELGMEYILGARERTSNVIRDVVLADTAPMVPLVLERQAGDTQLWVKEVRVGKGADAQRYVVTLNDAEARKDKADRQAIIDGLQTQLKKGDKALVGNSAYRRYLKATGKTFEIDMGKLADEARYDGISVLRTNARITPLQAVIRYRDLLQVEALFRVAKASFDSRPIFHQSDAAIRGHVFVSFLALTLAKELTRLCQEKGLQPEWQPLLNDLDRLQEATIEKDGVARQSG
jgi:transposase